MSDVRVLSIRISDRFPKNKWEADALWAEASEKRRTMLAAWRPERLEGAK